MSMVGCDIVVTNEAGERLQANITSDRWPLIEGVGPDFEGAVQGAGKDFGFAFWNAEEGGMRVRVECVGYDSQDVITTAPQRIRVTLKKSAGQWPAVTLWHRDALNLRDNAGRIQKVRGVSAFSLQMDFNAGHYDKLMRFAEAAHAHGVNTARYFTMFKDVASVGRPVFSAKSYTAAELAACVAFVREKMGLRAWPVAFCDQFDGSPVKLSQAEQDAHWVNVQAAFPDDLEGVNEPSANANANGGYELSARLSLPVSGAISFRGCVSDGENPRLAGGLWDSTTLHPPRGAEQGRKPGKVCYEDEVQGAPTWLATGLPARAGEPFRISEATERECADAAAAAEIMGSGFVIHDVWGNSLQDCVWPTGQQDKLDAIKAVWDGLNGTADFDTVSANYDRDGIVSGPDAGGASRFYTMWRVDRGLGVICYANPATAVANNGWRIVERRGYNGNVVLVER